MSDLPKGNAAFAAEVGRRKKVETELRETAAQLARVKARLESEIAERKRAEAALAEERNLLRTLIDNLPDYIFVKDKESRFILNNKAHLQVLGASTQEEVLGKTDFDIFPRELAETYFADEQAVIESGRPLLDREESTIDPQGRVQWLATDKVPLRDSHGSVVGIVGMSHDITNRKRAEEALRAERDHSARIIRGSPAIICGIAPDGTTRFLNPAGERVTGYSADELIGHNWWEVFYPGDEYRQVERLFKDFKHGDVRDYEMVLTTRTGEKRIISWNSINRVDEEGRLVEIIGFGNDVTERRRAEQALQQSEERYALAQRAAHIGSWDWDMRTGDLHWSDTIEPMFGFGPGEFGATYEEFLECVHPDDRQFVLDSVSACVEQGNDYAIEHRIVWPDGTVRWVSETGDVIRDESGRAVRMLGVVQDITERKQAESKLKLTMEELERSNRELEQFAYIASHDLQEPLRMVSSFTQLLARRYEGQLDENADEYIAFAADGAKRMQRLLNGLLVYSRVTTRAKPFEPTDCESVFRQALDNLKLAIEDAGASISHDPLPTVPADESQLIQLFQNLIGNALKFRGDSSPSIHVSANKTPGQWVFSVRDNGIGIPPEHHERIFQIFQRVPGKSDCPGTGIGLAVCQKIVQRHKGRIWVESEPGKGSTFCFSLPTEGG